MEYTPTAEEVRQEIKRLVPKLNEMFREHSLIDLTDFINKYSTEGFKHPGFVRNLAFKMEALGYAEVIPRKEWAEFYIKRTVFSKRHPYRYAITIGTIGLLFSILIGVVKSLTDKLFQSRNPQQTTTTTNTAHKP